MYLHQTPIQARVVKLSKMIAWQTKGGEEENKGAVVATAQHGNVHPRSEPQPGTLKIPARSRFFKQTKERTVSYASR
jgi:hypothetical protein